MNQIYNFEQHKPPVLNENMLRAELERRRLRWQTALVAVAGTLLLIAAAMLGFLVLEDYPWITALCLAYVLFSATGGSVWPLLLLKNGGDYPGVMLLLNPAVYAHDYSCVAPSPDWCLCLSGC